MARDFESTSSQYLTDSALPLSGPPYTFALWCKPESVTVLQALIALNDSGGTHRHQLELTTSGTVLLRTVGSVNVASGAPATTLTSGKWHHLAGVAATISSRISYVDGVAGTENTTSCTPSSIDTLYTGVRYSSGLGAYADGLIAERGIWNVALTAAEIASLAQGYSPLFVRPQSLVSYCPLFGDLSPEPDLMAARTLALTNAPINADHPLVIRHRAKVYSFPDAGATIKSISDTGAGTDATPTIAVSLGLSDTGTGADTAPGAAASVPLADSGSAADLIAAISAAVSLTDNASGADAISIITDVLLSVTDSGTAADVIASILATLDVSDVGAGVDAITNLNASLGIADTGLGVDAIPAIAALLALSDTATGADAVSVLQEILISIVDSLVGADTVSLTASVSLSDSATGVDILQSVSALLALADSGIGIDVAARFDAEVRLLKMTFTVRMRRISCRMAKRSMTFKLAA